MLFSHEKEQNSAICSNMDATRDFHISEVSQKKKNSIWWLLYVKSKNGTNEPNYRTETHSQTWRTYLWLPRGREQGMGRTWEFGVSRCQLLHLKWISNEVLLYSTGNYIQSLGIDNDRRKGIDIYVWLGHFAVHQKLAQNCQSTIISKKKNNAQSKPWNSWSIVGISPATYPQLTHKGWGDAWVIC